MRLCCAGVHRRAVVPAPAGTASVFRPCAILRVPVPQSCPLEQRQDAFARSTMSQRRFRQASRQQQTLPTSWGDVGWLAARFAFRFGLPRPQTAASANAKTTARTFARSLDSPRTTLSSRAHSSQVDERIASVYNDAMTSPSKQPNCEESRHCQRQQSWEVASWKQSARVYPTYSATFA